MSYIKLDRRMLDWGWKDIPEMVALWVDILLEANYSATEWRGETYEEGSFPTSVEKLSIKTGLSVRTVRTCLERLKKTNEITIKTTNQGTKIIVNKWAEYQCPDTATDKPSDKRPTNKRQTADNQTTTLKEIEEDKKNKKNNIQKAETEIVGSPALKEAFEALLEVRKAKKVPNTDRAVRQIINKLNNLAPNDEDTQITLLNTAVERGWATVFPDNSQKTYQKAQDVLPTYSQSKNRKMSKEEEDELLALMGKKYDDSNNPKLPPEKKEEILRRMGRI